MKVVEKNKVKIISLDEYLEMLTEDEIDERYDMLGLKLHSTDVDHETKVNEIKVDMVAGILLYSKFAPLNNLELLKNIIETKTIDNVDEEEIEEMIANSILLKDKDGYYIIDEIEDLLEDNLSKESINERKDTTMLAYLLINGVISIDKLIELLKKNGLTVTKKEIKKHMATKNFEVIDDLIYFDSIAKDMNENNEFIKYKDRLEYRVLEYDECMQILELFLEEYHYIAEFFDKKIKDEQFRSNVARYIVSRVSVGDYYLDDVYSFIDSLNIKLTKKNKIDLEQRLEEVSMEIPHWDLNGFEINDIDDDMDMDDILEKGFAMFSEEEKVLHYCNCYVLLNGIIKIDDLLAILNEKHNFNVTRNQLIEIASTDCEIKGDYITVIDLDEINFKYMVAAKGLDKFYIIESLTDTMMKLAVDNKNICDILSSYKLDNYTIGDVVSTIQLGTFNEKRFISILNDYNVKMSDKKKEKLLEDLTKVVNDYRAWYLNGFTVNEVKTNDK